MSDTVTKQYAKKPKASLKEVEKSPLSFAAEAQSSALPLAAL
jgi:hypothetical protein